MPRHTLGLDTKAERDYAEAVADQSFARGIELAARGNLVDLVFEIGVLHGISLLARQEKARELDLHVSKLKARLDTEARKLGR
jgi:hypothetical protein